MSIVLKLGIIFLNIIYFLFKLLPQQKKITFISRQSDFPSDDINILSNKIREIHSDYKTVILCRYIYKSFSSKVGYAFHMLKQMYHIATSEAVVLDSYCIAISVLKHRKALLVIQMWHSIGTMKKFGYSILDKPEGSSSKIANLMRMHANYDYILSAGDGYKEHLSDGFNYPLNKIVTLPLPRVELLKSVSYAEKTRSTIFSTYPELNKKPNILYVPTFRKSSDSQLIEATNQLIENFDYEKYNLIIKLHPLSHYSNFDNSKAIIDTDFSSFDMLFISDAVISDYSCIMYEAAVLKLPIYLYAYDYHEYMSTRDIYMDYLNEVPGPVCMDYTSLLTEINSTNYDYNKLSDFLSKYVKTSSPSESTDIVNFIFDNRKTRN